MYLEERTPGHAFVSDRCWVDSILHQDTFYGRAADNDIEVFKSAFDSCVAPARILRGRFNDQVPRCILGTRLSWIRVPSLRSISRCLRFLFTMRLSVTHVFGFSVTYVSGSYRPRHKYRGNDALRAGSADPGADCTGRRMSTNLNLSKDNGSTPRTMCLINNCFIWSSHADWSIKLRFQGKDKSCKEIACCL
jgi:hypothetical protein